LRSPGCRSFNLRHPIAPDVSARTRPVVYPLQTARITSPNDLPQLTMSTQILTTDDSGVTVVFDGAGNVRHVIPTSKDARD